MGACAQESGAVAAKGTDSRTCGAHLGLGLLELLGKVCVVGRNLGGILSVSGLALAVDGGQVLLLKAALCETWRGGRRDEQRMRCMRGGPPRRCQGATCLRSTSTAIDSLLMRVGPAWMKAYTSSEMTSESSFFSCTSSVQIETERGEAARVDRRTAWALARRICQTG